MTYKDEIKEEWTKAGGLITKVTAARILGVNQSVISRRKDIRRWIIDGDEFVSYTEIMNRDDIKPRRKRKSDISKP